MVTMLKPRVATIEKHAAATGGWSATRRASRHARGYGAEWDRARAKVMERDRGLCQPCARRGHVVLARDVDHKVPKFEGGSDDEANLQAICADCHRVKTAEESKRARGVGG